MANFKHSIDYKFKKKKCLIIYLLLVCVLIGARTSSKMVGKVDKNPATVQVAKPIMDLVVNNTNSINILPNQTVEYKLNVNNYIGSTITETKIQFKFNMKRKSAISSVASRNYTFKLFEVNGATETEIDPNTYTGSLISGTLESKSYILRVTWLDDGIDYNTVRNLSAFLDVTVDGVQQIT